MTLHKIDPKGDVIIVLQAGSEPFAPWDELATVFPIREAKEHRHLTDYFRALDPQFVSATTEECTTSDISTDVALATTEVAEVLADEAPTTTDATATDATATDATETQVDDNEVATQLHDATEAHMATDVLPPEDVEEVRLLVSSRHLSLASEYFLKLLAGFWKETSLPNALPTVIARDWDEDSFLILMKVIHGRLDDVPTVMGLEMVAQVAVLVDYYKCHEAMKFASKLWLEKLSKQVLKACSRSLVLKIFVAWVFNHRRLFAKATKIAILTCQGVLPTLGLPIPDTIIEEIERRRQKSLYEIANTLHSLHAYLKGRAGCSDACSNILCGVLTDTMYTSGFLELESAHFLDQSVTSLSKVIREIETPQWHLTNTRDKKACALSTFLRPCIDRIEYDMAGLELQQFRR